MLMTSYAAAGVNIDLGDDVSRILYEAAKRTWDNRRGRFGEVVELFPDFSGLRAIHIGGLPYDAYMNIGFDGVGTKMELAERIAKHDTVAYDLFAMVCDDAVVRGAEPVLVGSILDVRSLGEKGESYIDFVKQLAVGYINAAKEANVAVVNGEVAELGARVQGYSKIPTLGERVRQAWDYVVKGEMPQRKGFHYNWGAGVVWFGKKDRLLTGYEVKEGDYLVGLREFGFRSNGLSLVRKIMREKHGRDWHNEESKEEFGFRRSFGEAVLQPSKIYSAAVVEMFGGFEGEAQAVVHGVAHITGGGMPGKLGRVLKPSGLGAFIEDPFEPGEIMKYCQKVGNVPDQEAYKTWNMGTGMIIITSTPDDVIRIASEHDIQNRVIGRVTREPTIKIKNKGVYAAEKILSF